MKPENRPLLEWRLRIVQPKHEPIVMFKIDVTGADGNEVALWSARWETGRPTPSELLDLTSKVTLELADAIVSRLGVQGVL